MAFKKPFMVGYFDPRDVPFWKAGCYLLDNGKPLFDVVCLFAANINGASPCKAELAFGNVKRTLAETDDVAFLRSRGISVLLTVLGNHQPAGWSSFPDVNSAAVFAADLVKTVADCRLDGIDIDDEYSCIDDDHGRWCAAEYNWNPSATNTQSLIKAARQLSRPKPDGSQFIISKALFDDLQYFKSTWTDPSSPSKELTLAQQLTHGWEMTYGSGDANTRLQPYTTAGGLDGIHALQKQQLALGIWHGPNGEGTPADDVKPEAQSVVSGGYGGVMLLGAERRGDAAPYAQIIVPVLYPGRQLADDASFDDLDAAHKAGSPVTKIVVRWADAIDSIQTTNGHTQMPKHGGDGGNQTSEINDTIIKASGYTGTYFGHECILNISFVGEKDNYGPYGNTKHDPNWTFTACDGHALLAFGGTVATVGTTYRPTIVESLYPQFGKVLA